MSSLSQALHLGYLPSPHSAFQGHAAHVMQWRITLNPKDSWDTYISQGVDTFLPTAFTAHPFLRQYPTFRLHCGSWVVDCIARQAYNVFVIIAPYERWAWG